MPITTTRQRVLACLRKQGVASAAQIGRALNLSAADMRHHLSILVADERIKVVGMSHRGARGRPVKLYRLSEKSLGENLGLLADGLLHEWLARLPDSERELAMAQLARTLNDRIGRPDANIPIAKRLAPVMTRLNDLHYAARWEAGAQGPRILFAHCPYAAIIDKHPELCRMDAALLGEQFDAQADQVSKIDPKPGGASHCIFVLRR